MKRFQTSTLMLVLALVMIAGIAFAGPDKDERTNSANLSYSKLHSIQYISLFPTTKAMTPTDVTSTNTISVGYFPKATPLPCKVVITGASSTPVLYAKPYASSLVGLDVPTATCAYLPLDTNRQWSKIFTGQPNLTISAPTVEATLTVELWVQP